MNKKYILIAVAAIGFLLIVGGIGLVLVLKNQQNNSITYSSANTTQQLDFKNTDGKTTVDKVVTDLDKQVQNIDNTKDFENFDSNLDTVK